MAQTNRKKSNSITFDDEIFLIKKDYSGIDDMGNVLEQEIRTPVLCNKISIGRDEFYKASQSNLKANYTFTINFFEYDNETIVEHENKLYSVIRTYQTDEFLEITVGEKIGSRSET